MSFARLFVTVGARTEEFDRAMSGIQQKTKTMGQSLQTAGKRITGVGTSMTKMVTGPIVAVGAGLLGLAKKWASTGDHIAKTSTKLGISTDALQEMDYWASQNGLSSEKMERAVGRLNQRIGRAAAGNEKYTKAFQDIDVAVTDAEGSIRDTEDVMQDTIAALRDIEEPAARSAAASEIFGTKMARDLMPALDDTSMSLEEATKRAHELGIVMDEDAIKAAEDFEDAWDDMSRQLGTVGHKIGAEVVPIIVDELVPAFQENIIPALENAGEKIGNLIKWFADLEPRTQGIILGAIGLAAALGPVLIVVGMIVTAIGTLLPVLGFLLSPIGLIILVVAALVAAFIYLWHTNEGFRNAIIAIWNAISAAVSVAVEAIREVVSRVIGWLVAFWERNGEEISETWQVLWDNVQTRVAIVLAVIQAIIEFALNNIRVFWDAWGDTIMGVVTWIWEGIQLMIQTVMTIIEHIIMAIMAAIRGDWDEVWNRILEIGRTIWNYIKVTAANYFNMMRKVLEDILEKIRDYADKVWTWIRERTIDRVIEMYEGVRQWFQTMRDTLSDIWESIKDTARGAVDALIGIVDRIRAGFATPINWVITRVINPFLSGINKLADALGIDLKISALGTVATATARHPRAYHEGGLVGRDGRQKGTGDIKPDEEFALLQKGEYVLSHKMLDMIDKFREPETNVFDYSDIPSKLGIGGVWEMIQSRTADMSAAVWDGLFGAIDGALGAGRTALDAIKGLKDRGPVFELAGAAVKKLVDKFMEDLGSMDFAGGDGTLPGAGGMPFNRLIAYLAATIGRGNFNVTSTYRPGSRTLSGALSRHARGLAADFTGPNMMLIWRAFSKISNQLHELVYSPAPWGVLGGRKRPSSSFSAGLRRTHYCHVHAALAEGGVVTKPTSALVGESGPEAILPLNPLKRGTAGIEDKLDKLIDTTKDFVSTRRERGDIVFDVDIDGRQVARAIVPYTDEELERLRRGGNRAKGRLG